MWQDLLPERWEARDDRQAALEAGDGFRCAGNGMEWCDGEKEGKVVSGCGDM